MTPWHYRATQSIPSMLMLLLWTHICDRYRIIIAGCMYCYWLRGKERERVGVYERDTRAAACPESLTRVPQSVVRTADSQAPVLACMSSLHLRATTRRRLAASYSTNARHLSLNTRAVLTLSLADTVLERPRLVHLGGREALAALLAVRVPHRVSHGALERRSGPLQFVATARLGGVRLRPRELLVVIALERREARSLSRLATHRPRRHACHSP